MSNTGSIGEQYCSKCGKQITGDQIFIYDTNYCNVEFYCKECYKKLNPTIGESNAQPNNSYVSTDRELLWQIISKLDQLREEIKNK